MDQEELEAMNRSELWKFIKAEGLKEKISYGSKSSMIEAYLEIMNVDEETVEEIEEEEYPEIASIDDVPDDNEITEEEEFNELSLEEKIDSLPKDEDELREGLEESAYIVGVDPEGKENEELLDEILEKEAEEEKFLENPPMVIDEEETPVNEEGGAYSVVEEVEDFQEEETKEEVKKIVSRPVSPRKKGYIKVYNNVMALKVKIGSPVIFKCNYGKGSTEWVGDPSVGFMIKKFQKGASYKGRMTPRIKKLIRTKSIIIIR